MSADAGRPVRLGAVFLPSMAPEQLRSVAVAADAAALPELWLWEDCFKESGIASAAAVLAWTPRLRVGIGLLPVPLRNVAIAAMELATLERLFPGRLVAGIGHGVQDWMGQVGARVASPMTLLREHALALRSLLDGERLTTAGRYVQLDDVALDWPPSARPELMVGAVGPRTLALSGELADGTILTGGTSPAEVARARAIVDSAASAAGRGPHRIVVFLIAATGADAQDRVDAELVRWKLPVDADHGTAGDADAVAAAVRRWAEAGADSVVLQPTEDEPDVEGFVRFVAQDVRAALDATTALDARTAPPGRCAPSGRTMES